MTATIVGSVEVEVALGLGLATGAGRWDDPAAVFGVTKWAQADTALGDYVDVTCETVSVRLQSGGSTPDSIVPLFTAATASVVLVGGRWDPWSGPWAGVVGEGLSARVRVRPAGSGAWSTAIIGTTTAYDYDPMGLSAALEVTDASIMLAGDLLAVDPPVGNGETAAQRVTRILDYAEWPGARDLVSGGVQMMATDLNGAPAAGLRLTAESDMGYFWIARDGTARYRPGGWDIVEDPQATLTVCPTDVAPPGTDPTVPMAQLVTYEARHGGELRNIVNIGQAGGDGTAATAATVRDQASVSRFGPRVYTRDDLVHIDTAQSQRIAGTLIARDAWPKQPPADIQLATTIDLAAGPLLVMLDVLDRIDLVGLQGNVSSLLVTGWDVDLTYGGVTGLLYVLPIATVAGAVFDRAIWDQDRWEAS